MLIPCLALPRAMAVAVSRHFFALTHVWWCAGAGGPYSPEDSLTPDVNFTPAGLSRVSPSGHIRHASIGDMHDTTAGSNGATAAVDPFISPPRLQVRPILSFCDSLMLCFA